MRVVIIDYKGKLQPALSRIHFRLIFRLPLLYAFDMVMHSFGV